MNCTHVEKLLALHVENDLNGAQSSAVAAHLATCSGCRELAARFRASQSLLRLHEPPDFDAAFFDGIRRNVRAELDRDAAPSVFARFINFAGIVSFVRFARQTSPRRMAFAASLALLLLFFGATALRSLHDRAQVETALQLPSNDAATAVSEPKSDQPKADQNERGLQGASPLNSNAPTARRRHAKPRHAATTRARGSSPSALQASNAPPVPPAKFIVAPDSENTSGVAQSNAGAWNMNATELARGSGDSAPEMLRIELQTGDPNIRIIWLSPTAADSPSTKQKLDIR